MPNFHPQSVSRTGYKSAAAAVTVASTRLIEYLYSVLAGTQWLSGRRSCFFKRMGHTRPLFAYFRSFQPQILQRKL